MISIGEFLLAVLAAIALAFAVLLVMTPLIVLLVRFGDWLDDRMDKRG